jgi:hypothetical protein
MKPLIPAHGSVAVAAKYVFLVLVVTCAYYPSLFQAARADQFVYLYTTKDKTDLYSLTLGTYSWNREIGGDIHFFRPLLFVLLGSERWAFSGCNFFAWQLTNLLLHLTVVVLLFRLLQTWHGRDSWLALVTAAFFGVQYASMELVAWHHLSGYLLFCVLFMGVFCTLAGTTQTVSRWRQAALVLLLLLAAFTLELGNVLAVLVAGYLFAINLVRRPGPRPFHGLTVLAALLVPLVYTVANLADQTYRCGHAFTAGPAHEGCLSPAAGLAGMASAVRLWSLAGFLPSKIDLGVDSRMSIVAIHHTFSGSLALQAGVALLALVAFLVLLGMTLRHGLPSQRVLLGLLALLFGLVFTAVIVFLRAGPRGLHPALGGNSYYAYLFNLPILIFLASLVDLGEWPSGSSNGPKRLGHVVLGTALAALALTSAWRVHAQGRAEAAWARPTLVLVEQIRRLQKAQDDDFTFCVAPDHPGERELPYVGNDPSDGHPLTVAQVLFPYAYTRTNPKFVLWKRYHGFDVVTCNGRVFGIPPNAWPADLPHISPEEEARCIIGATPQEVEQGIDQLRRQCSRCPD